MSSALTATILLLALLPSILAQSLSCKDHPAYTTQIIPVLAKSWVVMNGNTFHQANYHPRYTHHTWAPLQSTADPNQYTNLDLFWTNLDPGGDKLSTRLYLQRPAKVYLAIALSIDPSLPKASLPGWYSEGYVIKTSGSDMIRWGVHQTHERWAPSKLCVFSKLVSADSVDLPGKGWVRDNVRGISTDGDWIVFLAEADGTPSAPPQNPPGIPAIAPNAQCPDALHDLWLTPNTDHDDEDTRSIMWRTWHPMWDPCYWCAYDHEHGSSAKHIMGYEPKYEYTAWKNDREDELHPGFKSMVFREGDYFVHWSVHAQTSNLRRVATSVHTVSLAVTHATTRELLVELTHKGYFGFVAVRSPGKSFVGLTPEDTEKMEELAADNGARNKRSVNVIDMGSLKSGYDYRSPRSDVLRGLYEDWTTGPICSASGRYGMIATDFTAPITGIKSAKQSSVPVNLGTYLGNTFIRNDGSSRIVLLNDFELSADLCMSKIANNFGGEVKDGVFYTDAAGLNILSGPSRLSVRQYIKPGFKLNISGQRAYRLEDQWTGLLKLDAPKKMSSYGFGINPDVN